MHPTRYSRLVDRLEAVFVVCAMIVVLGGILALLSSGDPNDKLVSMSDGNPAVRRQIYIVYAISVILMARHFRPFMAVVLHNWPVVMFAGFSFLTITWSIEPEVTIRRSIALLWTTLFALYLISRYDLHRIAQLAAWALGICAVLSPVFVVMLPDLAIDTMSETGSEEGSGGWRGVFRTKNTLAYNMILGCLLGIYLFINQRRYRMIGLGLTALSVFLIIMAHSAMALILMLIVPMTFLGVRLLRLPAMIALPVVFFGLAIFAALFSAIVIGADDFLAALGRDATLTGRLPLWEAVWPAISERFWTGYGYGAFWNTDSSLGSSALIRSSLGWSVPNSHNGILEIWLDFGVFGVLSYGALTLLALISATRMAHSSRRPEAALPLIIILNIQISGLLEANLVIQNSIIWLLYTASWATLNGPPPSLGMSLATSARADPVTSNENRGSLAMRGN